MTRFERRRRQLPIHPAGLSSERRRRSLKGGVAADVMAPMGIASGVTPVPWTAVTMNARLLGADEPPPVFEQGRDGRSDILITVDHGGARIPKCLGDLGVSQSELRRHIAWDIGALKVARGVGTALDATVVAQNYSRLVIDCNRDPAWESSSPTVSEYTAIPGNTNLSAADREVRRRAIFDPYHVHIRELLDERARAGRNTILVAQHSMTDIYKGVRRPMHAAVMYNRDRRFAAQILENLRREPGVIIAENEPYSVSDDTDYSVRAHAEARGLLHVEIEIRQDLILDAPGQSAWAERIGRALLAAQEAVRNLG